MESREQRFVCWMLVLTMVASPCWVYAQENPAGAPQETIDLDYITPNAVVAAVAHPRRVLAAPEMAMMPIEIISAAANKELGIEPLDVEHLLLVVEPPTQGPPGVGLVVRFTKPYRLDTLKLPGVAEPENAERMKHVPIWAFHGADDPDLPVSAQQMLVDALKECGNEVHFTIYPGAIKEMYDKVFEDPELYEWMKEQTR